MNLFSPSIQHVLEKISRHCPGSLYIYLQCLNRADNDGKVMFTKQMVEIDMSEGWTKFRNQIKKLALENLLEWYPFGDTITITLAEIDA